MNKKNPMEIIKGPLSFVAGDVRVIMFSKDGSHSIHPCLYSGLKKHKKAALKKDAKAAFE